MIGRQRLSRLIRLFVLPMLFGMLAAESIQGAEAGSSGRRRTLVVRFHDRGEAVPVRSVEPAAALASARRLAHIYLVEIAESADLEMAIRELRQDPHVAFVERDH